MLLRRRALAEIGLLDERIFVYMDDVDLCDRATRAGWHVWYAGDATAVHFMGASSDRPPGGRASPLALRSMNEWFERRHGRAADQSFWGVGIPSMFGSLSHQPPGPVRMLTALGWWWHTPHDTAEHIDPENLTRDTRIVLQVLRRLLTSPVLPLDYTVYAAALGEELARLEAGLQGRIDISPLQKAVAELSASAKAILEASDAAGVEVERINASLMRAARHLVPLNYTSGERFHPDSALPHAPWPSLEGLRELAAVPPGSPETAFYAVHARQTRNRLAHELREANAALCAAFDA